MALRGGGMLSRWRRGRLRLAQAGLRPGGLRGRASAGVEPLALAGELRGRTARLVDGRRSRQVDLLRRVSPGASSMTGMRKREPHSGQAPDGPASWPAHAGGARLGRGTRSAALSAAGPAAPTTPPGAEEAIPWGHRSPSVGDDSSTLDLLRTGNTELHSAARAFCRLTRLVRRTTNSMPVGQRKSITIAPVFARVPWAVASGLGLRGAAARKKPKIHPPARVPF